MPTSSEDIEQQAIIDVEAAWAREIDSRVVALERGEVELYAAEDVFADARRLSR